MYELSLSCTTSEASLRMVARVFHFFTIFEIKKAWVRI